MKMVHPDTGASFECPQRQVETWRSAGWLPEGEAAKKTRRPSVAPPASTHETDQAPTGDNPEE